MTLVNSALLSSALTSLTLVSIAFLSQQKQEDDWKVQRRAQLISTLDTKTDLSQITRIADELRFDRLSETESRVVLAAFKKGANGDIAYQTRRLSDVLAVFDADNIPALVE